MKPLVYYCRWQRASLRLRGRDDTAVWGQLVFSTEEGQEETKNFHFNLLTSQLTLEPGEGELTVVLDPMGIPLEPQ